MCVCVPLTATEGSSLKAVAEGETFTRFAAVVAAVILQVNMMFVANSSFRCNLRTVGVNCRLVLAGQYCSSCSSVVVVVTQL